ncbi:hypothetical protein CPB84DRAFT_1958477 [Gymnopilus junonius]|uniref:Uncharacterized protein n=1 Tax=Gymnopilus junonius TaxID=109634 RepID=A0A9P5NY57_GYMJU|nr:hypothetical protein CPB84DRAFT_1958477 [Gymnopilus junonius]
MAQRCMAKWAALLTGNGKIVSSTLASFIPLSDYCRPVRISAVYFPAWIINAEVEANATYEKTQQNAVTVFRNTCVVPLNSAGVVYLNSYLEAMFQAAITGTNLPVLSAAPLWSRELDYVEPEPFTESLLYQHGEEVQCIPFTVSPFTLLDIPASSTDSSWSIAQFLQIKPSSIKPTLFSASPVLLPVYLAQYELKKSNGSEDARDTVTLFIQAHANNGAIMTERLPDAELDSSPAATAFKMVNDLGITKEFDLDAEVLDLSIISSSRVRVDSTSLRPIRDSTTAIADWLESFLGTYHYIEALASMGQLESDDDPRIRELTAEDSKALDKYFAVTSEITMVRRIMDAMSEVSENTKVLQFGDGMPKLESTEQASSTLRTKLTELEAKRAELKPRWWIEWEESVSKSEP